MKIAVSRNTSKKVPKIPDTTCNCGYYHCANKSTVVVEFSRPLPP